VKKTTKERQDVRMFGKVAVRNAEFFAKSIEITHMFIDTVSSLVAYVKALKDYSEELDEAWDNLLKSAQQAGQGKSVQKKAKTDYIK